MANVPLISLPQALAIERQLLIEEKYIIYALKRIKEERYAYRRQLMDLAVLTQDALAQAADPNSRNAEPATTSTDASEVTATTTHTTSLLNEFSLPGWDNIATNNVDLNLTVPEHNFHDLMDEQNYDETEIEDFEEDYELDMNMLMSGVTLPEDRYN